jgi:DNA-binding LytR/AlgR family response regulator
MILYECEYEIQVLERNMILKVGICDDFAAHGALLKQYIEGCQEGDALQVFAETDPRRFLERVMAERPRILFLDIDMDGMDGIELGEKIRAIDADTVLVYVTAHEKYALEAFRVRAFHYLIKPLEREKVSIVLDEALAFIKKSSTAAPGMVFTVQRKGETVSLPMAGIACFEKVGHKIRVRAGNHCEEYYGNFIQLMTQIGNQDFIQCHQGYIVNVGKIRAFRDKTIYLDDGNLVPVSRTYAEKVRDALAKRLFAGKDKA